MRKIPIGCLPFLVREVPSGSRFTHKASSVAGGLACRPAKVPRGHSSDYFNISPHLGGAAAFFKGRAGSERGRGGMRVIKRGWRLRSW
jgi:hypothetical protein